MASRYSRIPSATGRVTRRPSNGTVDPGPELRTDKHAPSREDRERATRRATRSPARKSRSVGADVLSFPAGRISGYNVRLNNRAYGRGTTAHRLQDQRSEEGIPVRAAVYTQDAGIRERVRIARRWSTGLRLGMWHVVLIAILIVLIAIVTIVGPLRDYYVAWREAGVLEVEYEAVSAVNEELTGEVKSLNSLGGIEEEARRRGYVYPNEEALVVEGLDEETSSEQEQVQKALDEYESGLPWYVHFLDGVLGYKAK